ncbi:NAD-dependent epimerase/dehydratase family protein [Chitinophaga tropicalis]|uniref:NAD-dependent epimerase/dehydratase family protein n=1 Tax=Chitinophaga tropicalis TaxID=2683588 RepID=A0A7K1TZF2_9BACT|nr:NAD-dependent epimerase/dehydratase family protein [Chitinophaga tropicalis]MVT07436.1 NAD-dependent epimerase/dehydratase family protein [Chitinophaga tropicalis]
MSQLKVLILGSSGFVGRNIQDVLQAGFSVYGTTRNVAYVNETTLFFDFEIRETWGNILALKPDFIINAAGYGVVKYQKEPERMKMVNYYLPYQLKEYLDINLPEFFWIQVGSAFEYDLGLEALNESSPAMPLTDYGISKQLFSQYLQLSGRRNYVILRPFAMFGPGEDESKIVPALVMAQRKQEVINLSSGEQKRDYFYVKDLAAFIAHIISGDLSIVAGEVINIGSSTAMSLRELAAGIKEYLPDFNSDYWNWGAVEQRENESKAFYNGSDKGIKLGFKQTLFSEACRETINYYYQKEI